MSCGVVEEALAGEIHASQSTHPASSAFEGAIVIPSALPREESYSYDEPQHVVAVLELIQIGSPPLVPVVGAEIRQGRKEIRRPHPTGQCVVVPPFGQFDAFQRVQIVDKARSGNELQVPAERPGVLQVREVREIVVVVLVVREIGLPSAFDGEGSGFGEVAGEAGGGGPNPYAKGVGA